MLVTKSTKSCCEIGVVCAEVLSSCGHSRDGTSEGPEAEGDLGMKP